MPEQTVVSEALRVLREPRAVEDANYRSPRSAPQAKLVLRPLRGRARSDAAVAGFCLLLGSFCAWASWVQSLDGLRGLGVVFPLGTLVGAWVMLRLLRGVYVALRQQLEIVVDAHELRIVGAQPGCVARLQRSSVRAVEARKELLPTLWLLLSSGLRVGVVLWDDADAQALVQALRGVLAV